MKNRLITSFLMMGSLVVIPSLGAAQEIMVQNAYARTAGKMAKSGAIFMEIKNNSHRDDRLLSASTDVAKRTELHTHFENADGVMKMVHVKEGFEIPHGAGHVLKRGGDHVMLMGLTQVLEYGDQITVTLNFEGAGVITIDVPVGDDPRGGDKMGGHSDSEHQSMEHSHDN